MLSKKKTVLSNKQKQQSIFEIIFSKIPNLTDLALVFPLRRKRGPVEPNVPRKPNAHERDNNHFHQPQAQGRNP